MTEKELKKALNLKHDVIYQVESMNIDGVKNIYSHALYDLNDSLNKLNKLNKLEKISNSDMRLIMLIIQNAQTLSKLDTILALKMDNIEFCKFITTKVEESERNE